MNQTLAAQQLFTGREIIHQGAVDIEQGKITYIGPIRGHETLLPGTLAPGLIDIQVNGGGGKLFNQHPSVDTLSTMFTAHHAYGTTAMLPTLITDELETMHKAADAMAQAIKAKLSGILGIHFEGPHLSVTKRGVHQAEHIRGLSPDEIALFSRKDLGRVMVTLAAESVPPEQIRQLVSEGVIVNIGHSNADYSCTVNALNAGATGFTHLFNAMSPFTSREPGVVGAALESQNAYCGIIADGHHAHPASIRIAHRCKPEHLILVTDAMSMTGTDLQEFTLLGETIVRQGDKLTGPQGQLAGSMLDMASAVRYVVNHGLSLSQGLAMAALHPAQFLKQSHLGSLQPGQQADLIHLDTQLQVTHCWLQGEQTYQQE